MMWIRTLNDSLEYDVKDNKKVINVKHQSYSLMLGNWRYWFVCVYVWFIGCFRMWCRYQPGCLRASGRTQCLSVHPACMSSSSRLCSGAECPISSSGQRSPGWMRGMAGWCSAQNLCSSWPCIYLRRTGNTHTHTFHIHTSCRCRP